METVAFLLKVMSLIPQIMQASGDVKTFIDWATGAATAEGGPTQEDIDALHAKEDELRAALNG